MNTPPIAVGVRLPLPSEVVSPADLIAIGHSALALGYSSFWVGDHVLLPEHSHEVYPYLDDGARPFRADSCWPDPMVEIGWLAGQLPEARFGTAVMILTLRRAALLAKQLGTLSWLTRMPLTFGVGTGWLRDEYDALGVPFEKRATRAKSDIVEIRQLLTAGSGHYAVTRHDGEPVDKRFFMHPRAAAPVEFIWGGHSPLALRIVASSCDGWMPSKRTISELQRLLPRLRAACDAEERDFDELRLVAKTGPGPDPRSGAIDKDNLAAYHDLGFDEVILELPYEPAGSGDAIDILERVAARSW